MENMNEILNALVASLLNTGAASFSQDGLNIETTFNDGCLNITASYASPEVDKAKELRSAFEDYVKSLSDDFFVEVVETFVDGQLKKIQDKVNSKNVELVKEGIDEFMTRLKEVAASKVKDLDSDIEDNKKELEELIEIRESYIHVLNMKF